MPHAPATHRRRRLALGALSAGALLVLTACGGTEDSAGQAWDAARAQLDEADSLRLTTETATAEDSVTVEVAGQTEADNGQITLRTRVGEDDYTMVIREVDGTGHVLQVLGDRDNGGGWIESELPEEDAGMVGDLVDSILEELPQAGALADADVAPQEVDFHGTPGRRYEIPEQFRGGDDEADEAEQDESSSAATVRVSDLTAFVVDEDGGLLGLVTSAPGEDGEGTEQDVRFADWNSVEPFTAPEAGEGADG